MRLNARCPALPLGLQLLCNSLLSYVACMLHTVGTPCHKNAQQQMSSLSLTLLTPPL